MQNCFVPGGTLAVNRGDEIVPMINTIAKKFENVVLTQDWHPRGHVSFACGVGGTAHTGPWNVCVCACIGITMDAIPLERSRTRYIPTPTPQTMTAATMPRTIQNAK